MINHGSRQQMINKAPDTDQFHKDFTAAFNLPGCQQTAKHCDGDT